MDTLTSQQCLTLANQLSALMMQIGDYSHTNFSQLSDDQKALFKNTLKALSDAAGMLYAYTVTLALEEAQDSIASLEAATKEMEQLVKTITKIQDWINIAATSLALASAIIEHNPKATMAQIKAVVQKIGSAKAGMK